MKYYVQVIRKDSDEIFKEIGPRTLGTARKWVRKYDDHPDRDKLLVTLVDENVRNIRKDLLLQQRELKRER